MEAEMDTGEANIVDVLPSSENLNLLQFDTTLVKNITEENKDKEGMDAETKLLELATKYEDAKTSLIVANKNVNDLEKQLEALNNEQVKLVEKTKTIENENLAIRSAHDTVEIEKNNLLLLLEKKNAMIESLQENETLLITQLKDAVDTKCNLLKLNNEMQNDHQGLKIREKKFEYERTILNSQISSLTEKLGVSTTDLQLLQLNTTNKIASLESQLRGTTIELNVAKETVQNLIDTNTNLNTRIDELTQKLLEQMETESKISENYRKEIDAKTKVAELYKTIQGDADTKTLELTQGISDLQKLLHEATEKYGELETKYKQYEVDTENTIEKKDEMIFSLKSELERATHDLKVANSRKLDLALGDLAPSAAVASKLFKSEMSLTQVYTQLMEVSNELVHEEERSKSLNNTLNCFVQELEERAPLVQQQKVAYEEAVENNLALTRKLESLILDSKKVKEANAESSKLVKYYVRENEQLKLEMSDLRTQICVLLKEIEQNGVPNGNVEEDFHIIQKTNEHNTKSTLPKTLLTFHNIQELQSKNQQLLGMIRELNEKLEDLKRDRDDVESGDVYNKIDSMSNRIVELTDAENRQTKMIDNLIKQRDMFRTLYHNNMKGKMHQSTFNVMDTTENEYFPMEPEQILHNSKEINAEISFLQEKLKVAENQIENLQNEHQVYKEDKKKGDKILYDEIDTLKQEITKLMADNNKYISKTEYNNERIKTLQANITNYKKQIASLEEENKIRNNTITNQECSLKHLRDELRTTQNKLATAEIALTKLTSECNLMRETEVSLHNELDKYNQGTQEQSVLLTNVENIKMTFESFRKEHHEKLEKQLVDMRNECAAIKKRLFEEQDEFRELKCHLEQETERAKKCMEIEKEAAGALKLEILQLKQKLSHKHNIENLQSRSQSDGTDVSLDFITQIKHLETKVLEKDNEIDFLKSQIDTTKEHVKQYCNISQCAEVEMTSLSDEYKNYKLENEEKQRELLEKVQKLQDRCSKLEKELSLQVNEENSIQTSVSSELMATKEDLKVAIQNLKSCRNELGISQTELVTLSEKTHALEEKYAHEVSMHSADIIKLDQVKEELSLLQIQFQDLSILKENLVKEIEDQKLSWLEREKVLLNENEMLLSQLKDLNSQNSLLHDQIQELSIQLSVIHASRSSTDNLNRSINNCSVNSSINEQEDKSSEQLLHIIKFLRKEKECAISKYNNLESEMVDVKSQLEIALKTIEDNKAVLLKEIEATHEPIVTVKRQSHIIQSVEKHNALSVCNRILQQERDDLLICVEELKESINNLEKQIIPLEDSVNDLTSRNDILQSENTSLKSDSAWLKNRVDSLVERANKMNPDDWKRLQNERDSLSKMLTTEKEIGKKLNEEMTSIKSENLKVEEQCSTLLNQHTVLMEDNKKINQEILTFKNDVAKLSKELSDIKQELEESSQKNADLLTELSNKEASLIDIRNKEIQIRKIAKKYKSHYEELTKSIEDKKESNIEEASEANKVLEEEIAQLKSELETERTNKEILKSEVETLRTANFDKEEKAKQVLKQAKSKIVQLTETKNSLTKELSEVQRKESLRDEQDSRLAAIQSQYEGRLARLEKEKSEALAEKAKEAEALLQKMNQLQRQLSTQASSSKQQVNSEKSGGEPPTANIKPMAGVAQQSSRRGGETPLASIRPMAQVGPTAPHDAHSTEYMPASSSRSLPRAATQSTQDLDAGDASTPSSAPSDSTTQPSSHCQPVQCVALVMPRIEQSASGASTSSASAGSGSGAGAGAGVGDAAAAGSGGAAGGSGAAGEPGAAESTSRPAKRTRPPPRSAAAKRSRLQGFERSDDVEYQVPTSSRCDQDDEGVIVVDSEEEDCDTGVDEMEDDEAEEEQEVDTIEQDEREDGAVEDSDNCMRVESPAQSMAASQQGATQVAPQIEAISSGTEAGVGAEEGDDSIVPSTPTLYVPRRGDGFGVCEAAEPAAAEAEASASADARFTFAEAGAAEHHDTHADLAAALPPAAADDGSAQPPPAAAAAAAAAAEEGREAEASAAPAAPRLRPPFHTSPHSQ